MNEKKVRLFHKGDWIDINFPIRSIMTKTTLNKMTITEDEIDNYVVHQIHQTELYWFANTSEETPEETLAKDQNTSVQDNLEPKVGSI